MLHFNVRYPVLKTCLGRWGRGSKNPKSPRIFDVDNRVLLNRTGPDPYLETSTCTLETLVFCTMQVHDDPKYIPKLNFLGEI